MLHVWILYLDLGEKWPHSKGNGLVNIPYMEHLGKIVQIAIFEKKITFQNIMFGFNVRFSRCVFYNICRYAYSHIDITWIYLIHLNIYMHCFIVKMTTDDCINPGLGAKGSFDLRVMYMIY